MTNYGRDLFLYMPPTGDEASFAQCGACRLFVPPADGEKSGHCVIHGSTLKVDADASCGLFVAWGDDGPSEAVIGANREELAKGDPKAVTPQESGFLAANVQCHRCKHFEAKTSGCDFFAFLNKQVPSNFKVDTRVEPHACCNAWVAATRKAPKPRNWYGKKES